MRDCSSCRLAVLQVCFGCGLLSVVPIHFGDRLIHSVLGVLPGFLTDDFVSAHQVGAAKVSPGCQLFRVPFAGFRLGRGNPSPLRIAR